MQPHSSLCTGNACQEERYLSTRLGNAFMCPCAWEGREYRYVGVGGQGVHVCGYGRAGSTGMWVWEAREYMYVGMGGQGVQVRGYGRAGSTGTWV